MSKFMTNHLSGTLTFLKTFTFSNLHPFNPFPNKPWVLRVCSLSLLKTLSEKEKLLVTCNFSFSHSVFYPFGEITAIFIKFEIVVCKLFEFGIVSNLSFGNRINGRLEFCTNWYKILKIFRLITFRFYDKILTQQRTKNLQA